MGDGACGVNGFATGINVGSKIILIFCSIFRIHILREVSEIWISRNMMGVDMSAASRRRPELMAFKKRNGWRLEGKKWKKKNWMKF